MIKHYTIPKSLCDYLEMVSSRNETGVDATIDRFIRQGLLAELKTGDIPDLGEDVYQAFVDEECDVGVDEWTYEPKLKARFERWVESEFPAYLFHKDQLRLFRKWIANNFNCRDFNIWSGKEFYGIRLKSDTHLARRMRILGGES